MSFLGMFIQFVIILLLSVLWAYQWAELPPLAFQLLAAFSLLAIVVFALRLSNQKTLLDDKALGNRWFAKSPNFLTTLLNLLAAMLMGFIIVFAHAHLSAKIADHLYYQPLVLQAKVVDLVKQQQTAQGVQLKLSIKVDSIQSLTDGQSEEFFWIKPHIKLNWYLSSRQIKQLKRIPESGERWRFIAKLRQNHAMMNLGTRDYEAWLMQQGISAKGYISGLHFNPHTSSSLLKNTSTALLLAESDFYDWHFWRAYLAKQIEKMSAGSDLTPIYKALLIGDKQFIEDSQWQLLRDTGTSHLMAISGLHIGILALFGYLLFRGLWWLVLYRVESFNRPTLAALGAFVFATLYLMLSGASIPTQRAWLMVVGVLCFMLLKRKFQPWNALALAAFLVLLWHPSAVLSAGFWLSFMAVAIIFSVIKWMPKANWLQKLLLIQAFLTLGLAPLVIFYFQQLPLVSWLANLIAVPLVSFLALPLLMLTVLVYGIQPSWGEPIGAFNEQVWQWLWHFLTGLQTLAEHYGLSVLYPPMSFFWLATCLLFFMLFLAFLGKLSSNNWQLAQSKGLSSAKSIIQLSQNAKEETLEPNLSFRESRSFTRLILLLILIVILWLLVWPQYAAINSNRDSDFKAELSSELLQQKALLNPQNNDVFANKSTFEITVLDVSQGLAVAIATQHHLVVYDTGARWGKSDAAKIAILPYLNHLGWSGIDTLIVSHSDNDHAGGVATLLQHIPIAHLISGQVAKMPKVLSNGLSDGLSNRLSNQRWQSCHSGQVWFYDGVKFEFLSPQRNDLSRTLSDNDSSCVLKVSNQFQSALVMGDASVAVEKRLLNLYADTPSFLKANLLIAGHHGSKYSNSYDWLKAVKPEQVVFSAGYRNRYHFPAKQTLQRIQRINSMSSQPQIKWWNTACSGGIGFIADKQINLAYQARKKAAKWYHHRCNSTQQGILYQ